MKPDKLKKLFKAKRIIARALSAAMLVTSVPQTAFAAEAETQAVETQEAETQAVAETVEAQNEAAQEAEPVSSTVQVEESTAAEDAVEPDVQGAKAQEANEQEAEAQEADNQAEGDNTPAEVTYTLENNLEGDDDAAEIMKKSYNGEQQFTEYGEVPSWEILSKIAIKKNGEEYSELSNHTEDFTFTWKKDGAKDEDLATAPVNAGAYQMTIAPVADGQFANAEPITIKGFTIEKAEVIISNLTLNVKPGTKPEEVINSITSLTVSAENGSGSFTYSSENKENQLKVTVDEVIDPYTGSKTTDTYLKKNGDYTAKITVSFSDAKDADGNPLVTDAEKGNFNLPKTTTEKIGFADLKKTRTTLEVAGEKKEATRSDNGAKVQVITKTYDKNAAAVPSYTAKVEEVKTVVGEDGKETDQSIAIASAATEGRWHSAEFRLWEETKQEAEKEADGTEKKDEDGNIIYKNVPVTLCTLTVGNALKEGSAPTEAGTYVYRVSYAGDKEQYAASYADIVVEIAPVEVTVKPALADTNTKFYAGETVKDVLTKIIYSVDKEGVEGIWGTSYDAVDKTQPYEPVFGVFRVEKDTAVQMKDMDKLAKADGVTYEVRFTGKKAVRNENGVINSYDELKEINDETVDSYNSNYKTKTDADTIAKNNLVLALSPSDAKIDTTPITGDAALAAAGLKKAERTIDGNTIYTKVYKEGGALYDTRAAYKTATGDENLTYKWYKWGGNSKGNDAYYDINKAYVEVLNEKMDFKADWTPLPVNHKDFNSVKSCLSNAGIYKLEITCDNGSAYAQENVYYAIERQQLRLKATNVPEAHYGMDTEYYVFDNKSKFAPKLEINENNAGNWIASDWTQDKKDGDYSLDSYNYWYVEAKAPAPGKEGEKPEWDGWKTVWSFTERTGENPDQKPAQNEYRLLYDEYGVYINDSRHVSTNYTFVEYTVETKTEGENEDSKTIVTAVSENLSNAPITVKSSGEKKLTMKLPDKEIKAEKTYDNTPVTVDLSNVKYTDSDNKEITPQFVWEWSNEAFENNKVVSPEEAVTAGTYTIYAKYDGDENYAPADREQVATAVIKKAELTVTVTKQPAEEVKAGTDTYNLYKEYHNKEKDGDILTIAGFPEKETQEVKDAFTTWQMLGRDREDGNQIVYGYPVFARYDEDGEFSYVDLPYLCVYGSDNERYEGRLKSGEKYTINATTDGGDGELAYPYSLNYQLKSGKPVEITPAYVSAEKVQLFPAGSDSSIKINDKVTKGETSEKFAHEVTFWQAVPYTVQKVTENGVTKTVYGAWATVKITPPSEFEDGAPETAIYKNALEKAGGINVRKDDNGKITATFNLSKDGENGLEPNPVTFSILWKEGFVEKFTITPTQENLAADLRNAVAPKSVAFNAPKTKMVVGEVQDLDVKITKVQNEDLVYLDYRVTDGADVLAISSQGRVTALKEGNATVEVYPVKIVGNEKKEITDGCKPGQVKITVSKVAAPKVGKIFPADVSVDVQYPYVKNNGKYYDYGYRREIYVMPDNKKTVDDFEKAIGKFEETGDYKTAGLAANPVYVSNNAEEDIAYELARGIYTQYAYDENISGIAGGKNVTIQVKVDGLTPKTPYSVYVRNVSASRTVLDKDGNRRTAELSSNGMPKDFTTTLGQVKKLVVASEGEAQSASLYIYDDEMGEDRTTDVPYYEYDLTSGGVQLAVTGVFSALADEVDKAEQPDLSQGYAVPFIGADKAALKTKLLEPKLEYRMYQVVQEEDGLWKYVRHDYYDEIYNDWNREYTYAQYTKADKKGKLKFTQPEALAVTAYDTVTKTQSAPIIIRIKADADSAAGAKVTLQVGQKTPVVDLVAYKAGKSALDSGNPYFAHKATAADSDCLKTDKNGNITPVKFEKTASRQSVTVTAGEGPAVSGSATVTIKDLDPVKNLKFSNLIDNSFMLDFAPSIYAEGYIVDIKNSAGKLVQRKYISQRDEYLEECGCNDGYIWYYSAKKKAYVWQPDYVDRFKVTGLTANSKYNVTVTAVYGDAKSKPVSKAVTMTKLPAWDTGIANDALNFGMPIQVFAKGELTETDVDDYTFVSGNRYTLVADANQGAQYAVTDKLTWSSSDGKVAKISAVGGTYSANLKALKAGTTIIEVKSGILKQTIARWKVTVRSVGDAYNNAYFYDENEDLRGDGTDKYDTKTKLILNIPASVELAAGEPQKFSFTAEEAGNYKIVTSAGLSASPSSLENVKKGTTKTIKVSGSSYQPTSGTITVEKVPGTGLENRTPLKLNEKTTLSANGWGVFTAQKDGLYSFNAENLIKLHAYENGELTQKKQYNSIYYAMKAQDTVYVENDNSYENNIEVSAVSMQPIKAGEAYSGEYEQTYWYTFTAEEDGDYRFKAQNNAGINFSVYKDHDAINKNAVLGTTCTMKANDTVYVKAYINEYRGASFKVIKVEPVVITDNQSEYPQSAERNATTRYTLTPGADAVYTFRLDSSAKSMGIYLASDEATPLKSVTWNGTISYPLEAGTAYSLKVENDSSWNDLSLTVEKTVINALTAGGDALALAASGAGSGNDNYGWISFTAQDGEGFYKFTLENLTFSATAYIMEKLSLNNSLQNDEYIKQVNVSSSSNGITCYLPAGQKVWLRVGSGYNSYYFSDAAVKVEKTQSTILPFTTDEVTVGAGKKPWYSYQVESDGRYSFKCTSTSYNVDIVCYDDVNKQKNSFTERWLKAGSIVYIRLRNNGSSEATATLSATKIDPTPWTDVSVAQTIPANYKDTWFVFTAPEETEYTFTCKDSNGNASYVYLYTKEQFEAEGNVNSILGQSVTYPFEKGETVYLKTNSYNEASLTAEKVEFPELGNGENKITLASNTAMVKFTAPETGIYTFAPAENREPTIYLYADKEAHLNGSSSQSSSNNGIICYPLIMGTTVYLKINDYNSNEETVILTVSKDEKVTMEEVTLGKETSLSLTADEEKWIYFKVKDTNQQSYRVEGRANEYNYLQCRYASYLGNNNWIDSMGNSSLTVGQGYQDYAYVSNYNKYKVVYMYILPNNTGTVNITIKEEKN